MRKYLSLIISIVLLLIIGLSIWFIQPVPTMKEGEAGIGKTDSKLINQSKKTNQQPAIGGNFDLIDANNNNIDENILKGKFSLVYFGFTSCPAVCPTTLSNITNALNRIGDNADNIQPIFITIDPNRDTPEVMKDYISNFHPSFLALTGTEKQIDTASSAFKVYYQAETSGSKNYNVNHSDFIYLMDRTGKYITHFTQEDSAEKMSGELLRYTR